MVPYLVLVICLLSPLTVFPQNVLFDDANSCHDREEWTYFLDTLAANGAELHYTADEGWDNLSDMDMLWIQGPVIPYSDSLKTSICEFSRRGGKIVIGDVMATFPGAINNLLSFSLWATTTEIVDTNYLYSEAIITNFLRLSPFTKEVETVELALPRCMQCGSNVYPFAFNSDDYSCPIATIIYPFNHEDNCSSFVVLVSGTHAWESDFPIVRDNHRFTSNILLCAAGVEGYEIEPCASPKMPSGHPLCSATPNPFTPNGDGINDEVEFKFPGLGEVPGTIKIFTLGNLRVRTIEVPTGSAAKEAAKWDGRDDSGAPMRPGIYIYTIRAEGRIKCEGTVTLAR